MGRILGGAHGTTLAAHLGKKGEEKKRKKEEEEEKEEEKKKEVEDLELGQEKAIQSFSPEAAPRDSMGNKIDAL